MDMFRQFLGLEQPEGGVGYETPAWDTAETSTFDAGSDSGSDLDLDNIESFLQKMDAASASSPNLLAEGAAHSFVDERRSLGSCHPCI